MHKYPSDITREQFEIIRQDLEKAKKKTRPRKYDFVAFINSELEIGQRLWTKTEETGVSILDSKKPPLSIQKA